MSWIDQLNRRVLSQWNTCLRGGHAEPFYLAPAAGRPAEIRFTLDYERSALHELAHWCVAGNARRLIDDYGYWYAPDGRTGEQQQAFFQVEVRPQAIEHHLCDALGLSFDVSVDNLTSQAVSGIDSFRLAVEQEYRQLHDNGLPHRATLIRDCLAGCRAG